MEPARTPAPLPRLQQPFGASVVLTPRWPTRGKGGVVAMTSSRTPTGSAQELEQKEAEL